MSVQPRQRLWRWHASYGGNEIMRSPDNSSRGPSRQRIEDCTALEYILLGDLRDLLEDDVDQFTRPWLLAVLDALLDTLPREFRLKSRDGYLQEVLEEYPSWYRHVEGLRQEHEALYHNLRELRDGIARR